MQRRSGRRSGSFVEAASPSPAAFGGPYHDFRRLFPRCSVETIRHHLPEADGPAPRPSLSRFGQTANFGARIVAFTASSPPMTNVPPSGRQVASFSPAIRKIENRSPSMSGLVSMLLVELGGSTWGCNVHQTVRSLFVEADPPSPQRLAVHTTSFRRLFLRCSVEDRSDRQKPTALRPSSVWPNRELRRPE